LPGELIFFWFVAISTFTMMMFFHMLLLTVLTLFHLRCNRSLTSTSSSYSHFLFPHFLLRIELTQCARLLAKP